MVANRSISRYVSGLLNVIVILSLVTVTVAFPKNVSAAGSWTPTGSMAYYRDQGFTATLLNNGQIMVIGGVGKLATQAGGSDYLSSAELYDPAIESWTNANPMPDVRGFHTATLLSNGRLLIVGGFNGVNYLSTALLFDPNTNTWIATGSMSTPRRNHTAILLPNGKVMVTGGVSNSGFLGVNTSAELYDPVSGVWSLTSSMNEARNRHTATMLPVATFPSGKILVVGGVNSFGYPGSTEIYDVASGTWTLTSSLNYARNSHTATILPNGKVLVVGGNIGFGNYVSASEIYDPITETWAITGSPANIRSDHTATMLPNGQVLVTGGRFFHTYLNSAEVFDPVIGNWSTTGSLSEERGYHQGVLLPNGKVLVMGGQKSTNYVSQVELYEAFAPSTRFVAIAGTDNSDCSNVASPCATINYAISQAVAGNTIEIAAGTYTEAGITVDKDLTFTGAGATVTIVQASSNPGTAPNRVFSINNGVTATIANVTIKSNVPPSL